MGMENLTIVLYVGFCQFGLRKIELDGVHIGDFSMARTREFVREKYSSLSSLYSGSEIQGICNHGGLQAKASPN